MTHRTSTTIVLTSLALAVVSSVALPARPARAAREETYSLRGVECATCGVDAKTALKKISGVQRVEFDAVHAELTVVMADDVTDKDIIGAIKSANPSFDVVVGGGKGSYVPFVTFPAKADVATVTDRGARVGPLDKLRVPGKYTVFDVYAPWSGPSRTLDAALAALVTTRSDIAVRRLNLVSFDSPLARELGPRLQALPHVVIFTPDGRRTDLSGAKVERIVALLTPQ